MGLYIGTTNVPGVSVLNTSPGPSTSGHRFKTYIEPHNGDMSCIGNNDYVLYTFNGGVSVFNTDKIQLNHDGIETVRFTGEWSNSYNYGTIYINGVGQSIQANTTYTLQTDNDYADIVTGMCLERDTLITMADGSVRPICELKVGDTVMSLNPETLERESDEVIMADGEMNKMSQQYDLWKFEGGYEVKTINRHRFYNVEMGRFVYLDEWNLGEHAVVRDGVQVALLSHEAVEEEVQHCTIFTRNWNNYYANGLLSGNRDSVDLIKL